MGKLLIQNGTIVQPNGQKGKLDILIEDGIVQDIQNRIDANDAEIIDATGLIVSPGFIDMHVHLREPGQEYKEDIASGTLAALYGGYTGVACMPNTTPVNDCESVTAYIQEKAKIANHCHVYPVCAITKGLEGQELTEMGLLLQQGAVAFSDDGKPVSDANRMRLAIQYAKNFDALLMQHCEVKSLSADGSMNEGITSIAIGLKGIPTSSESAMVARDIELVREYGGRVHFCHMSAARSIELVRRAKADGLNVTCETAPHYFVADDTWVETHSYDANTKMSPPLRSKEDVEAIIAGLADGTIDAIATDHAPHHADEKEVEFACAMNGIIGLETAFSLGNTYLVKTGHISMERLIECMSTTPARILKQKGGIIEIGMPADITLIDSDEKIVYQKEMLHSKGKNSPFLGQEYIGVIKHTIVDGVAKF